MKTTIILISALNGALLTVPAFADTKTVQGCEVAPVDGSNYSVKADPTCNFNSLSTGGAGAQTSGPVPVGGFGS